MKVFGIGLSKTGTSSLASALNMLGYNVKDCLGVSKYTRGDLASIDKAALLHYDALTDTPIPSFYQELDKEYPASKFILTIRDMDGWLKSCKKQFNQKSADKQSAAHKELFLDIYGTAIFDEDKFKQGYLDFINKVKIYFKNRPDDLLIINVTNGEGWEKLCPFLDRPIPEHPFPKSNVTQIRWLNIHELAQSTRNSALPLHELSENLITQQSTRANKIKQAINSFFGISLTDRINKCADKTQQKIARKLLQLNANIPIISKTAADTPFETRMSWNHFWLINCSEGTAQSNNGGVGYTINLALIEDGSPYLGIIYLPELDTLYYAATDKGAYKVQGNDKPIKIELHNKASLHTHNSIKENATISINSSQNIGSILCQAIENSIPSQLIIESSKEWQIAAGHAILKTIGLPLIIEKTSHSELKYNKNDWINSSISIDIRQ